MPLTQVHNSLLGQPVNHNLLINPSFTVFQRAGTTKSGGWGIDHDDNIIGGGSFGPDGWIIRSLDIVGGTMLESTTDFSSGVNKMVVKHGGDTESFAYTIQRIEAVNFLGLYGKEMTFSFSYSDVGGSGIPAIRIRSYDSRPQGSGHSLDLFYGVPTPLGNNRWSYTFTLVTNDGTIPAPTDKGMYVQIYPNEGLANAAPDEWSLWETKLEVGSVATPFIARQFTEELALCQRYYTTSTGDFGTGMQQAGATYASNGTVAKGNANTVFPVSMRATPSVEVTIASGAATDVTFVAYGLKNAILNMTTQASVNYHYTADAEL
jgi:hypothetical protein